MKNSNILKSRKEGHYVYYSLVNNELLYLYQHITKYAINEIAELGKILNQQREDNKSGDAVSLAELKEMIYNNNILLLDVRPPIEYKSGHISGAISIPMNELLEHLKDIPREKEIIAYCRGPFCVLADEAVKLLNEKGYKVRRLDEGYPEWKIKQVEII